MEIEGLAALMLVKIINISFNQSELLLAKNCKYLYRKLGVSNKFYKDIIIKK